MPGHQPELHPRNRSKCATSWTEASGPDGEVFGVPFEELFEVVLINPETGAVRVMQRK
jgi:hypothetical protein